MVANVLNRLTKEFRLSVNTPDYPADKWICNPVMPGCKRKYLKIDGDTVSEMTTEEKEQVDFVAPKTDEQLESDRQDSVRSTVRKTYSEYDEFRIINKGIQNKTNEDYVQYLAFVTETDSNLVSKASKS